MTIQEYIDAVLAMQAQLYHMALSMLRNESDAADAVQEALLQGWKARHTLRDSALFRPWMMRILFSKCNDIGRKKQRDNRLHERIAQNMHIDISNARAKELHEALATLPETLRLPVLLYYFDGYSQKEIAYILGIQPQQVKMRIRQARARLNKLL